MQVTDARPVRTIFITGTGTGVGKTVLTALLLAHLRSTRKFAVAMKPFCSGSRGDARLLQSLQDGEPGINQINPFYFPEPVAPLVAARKHRRQLTLDDVVERIAEVLRNHFAPGGQSKTTNQESTLLIEGSGGVLVPLGEKLSVLDMISAVADEVIVVAPNLLGTLNHTLLSVKTLQQAGLKRISVVLMADKKPDLSSDSNAVVLSELLAPVPVHSLPFLGRGTRTARELISHATRLGPVLEDVLCVSERHKKAKPAR
jgi:dethiobiotin synthetase